MSRRLPNLPSDPRVDPDALRNRGTVRSSGRQPTDAGRIARLNARLDRWRSRRHDKLRNGFDTAIEDRWIARIQGQIEKLDRDGSSDDMKTAGDNAQASAGDVGATALSSRQADLLAFWTGLLPGLQERVPLFESVRPGPYPFIKKMSRGVQLRLNIKLDHSSVWLQVHRLTKEETEAVYRNLLVHKSEIEASLPDSAGWDTRPAGAWDSLLLWTWATRTAGLEDRVRWRSTQKALIDVTAALIEATRPFLPASDWVVRPTVGTRVIGENDRDDGSSR